MSDESTPDSVFPDSAFYATPIGQWVQRVLARELVRLLDEDAGEEKAFGYGYARPYEAVLRQCGWRVKNVTLDEISRAPRDALARLFMVHGLERAGSIDATLGACASALQARGQFVLIVPNRRGLWARRDDTPFGAGVSFSRRQIFHALNEAGFSVLRARRALLVPPALVFYLGWSEAMLRALVPFWGGVWVIAATKHMPATINLSSRSRLKSPAPIFVSQ